MTIESARKLLTSLTCGLMLTISLGSLQAQQLDAPAPPTPNAVQTMPVGHHGAYSQQYEGTVVYENCDCDQCRHGGFHNNMGRCKVSPGTGYAPPGKAPIVRTNVGYGTAWPEYWNGQGYGTPIPFTPAVYTPTDTTQLGYYYQTVPTWVPMPWMQPTQPVPSQWHRYGWGGGFYEGGYGNYEYGPTHGYGGGYGNGYSQPGAYCPTTVSTPMQTVAPEVAIDPIPEGSI